MEFDDQEEQEEEIGYESIGNSSRPKISTSDGGVVAPVSSNRKPATSRYRECLKNHAVSIGGHAIDGCGEFMAAGEEGSLDALKCAACNCHRNFHRKETEGEVFHHQFSPYYRPAGYLHVPQHRPTLALPSISGGGGHSREDQEDISNPSGAAAAAAAAARKRFRTKFTQEQKDKMLEFAERVGWRIQKHDEAAVQQFCTETNVKRHVLKVWMHNNKHTLGKKP